MAFITFLCGLTVQMNILQVTYSKLSWKCSGFPVFLGAFIICEKVPVILHHTIPRAVGVTQYGAGGNASYKILLVPDSVVQWNDEDTKLASCQSFNGWIFSRTGFKNIIQYPLYKQYFWIFNEAYSRWSPTQTWMKYLAPANVQWLSRVGLCVIHRKAVNP